MATSRIRQVCVDSLFFITREVQHVALPVVHRKRQLLVDALLAAGIKPTVSDGSFFIMGNTENLEVGALPSFSSCDDLDGVVVLMGEQVPQKYLDQSSEAVGGSGLPRDWAFARWLAYEAGIVCIPPSAFYRYVQNVNSCLDSTNRVIFCFPPMFPDKKTSTLPQILDDLRFVKLMNHCAKLRFGLRNLLK